MGLVTAPFQCAGTGILCIGRLWRSTLGGKTPFKTVLISLVGNLRGAGNTDGAPPGMLRGFWSLWARRHKSGALLQNGIGLDHLVHAFKVGLDHSMQHAVG